MQSGGIFTYKEVSQSWRSEMLSVQHLAGPQTGYMEGKQNPRYSPWMLHI